jgi:hypothetical protein
MSICLWPDWWNNYTENSTEFKLHCYFHNFELFIGLHTMNSLWSKSCQDVQFTSNDSHTVWYNQCIHDENYGLVFYLYIFYALRVPHSLSMTEIWGEYQWKQCTFHIQFCVISTLQGDSRRRSLFSMLFMIFWFWIFLSRFNFTFNYVL